jgi:hypothetical protein
MSLKTILPQKPCRMNTLGTSSKLPMVHFKSLGIVLN